ncbi:MAG TPA: DUF5615 family PIN-like protein [Rhizomicrobium sp.]|jgi:predicted nuclease of predicted toxin-antitoxin system
MDYAVSAQAAIVTKDEDFVLLARHHPGMVVIWVRFGNLCNRTLFAHFDRVWSQAEAHLSSGLTLIELI